MESGTTGIRFENSVSDSLLLGNRILGQGAGVALGDVDGDGLVDVFLGRTEGCSALYKNLGNWKFEDITKSAGVGACDRHSTGAAFADVDGNGTLDLILLATRGPNAIFLNDGKGHFTEHHDLGLDTTGRGGTTVAMADVDGSGGSPYMSRTTNRTRSTTAFRRSGTRSIRWCARSRRESSRWFPNSGTSTSSPTARTWVVCG